MPKRKKASKHDVQPNEGRPANFTLGDFISQQIPGVTNLDDIRSSRHPPSSEEIAVVCCTEALDDNLIVSRDNLDEESVEENDKYYVCRTKKGGIPVTVEKRSSGKKVTVVDRVSGNSKMLLQELKNKFGTGGVLRDGGSLELQGDCLNKVTKYLNENKHMLLPYQSWSQ